MKSPGPQGRGFFVCCSLLHQLETVAPSSRRATRKHYSAEEKIRIVLEGLRGEDSIAELCRREGIAQNLYYRWSKDFLEAGKKRLAGDTARAATSDEVIGLRREATALKEAVADLTLENRLLKKSVTGDGVREALERLDPLWDELFPAEQARIVQLLVERVDVSPDGADIRLRTEGLKNPVTELRAIKPELRRAA